MADEPAPPRKKPKRMLTNEMRTWVVTKLAQYTPPPEVQRGLKEEWGLDSDRQTIHQYIAHTKSAKGLAKRWVTLFDAVRKKFLEDTLSSVPEANKTVRVRMLADAARSAERRGNFTLMDTLLQSIAKEMGNVHTNKRELTGKDGGPLKYQDVDTMTDEQIDDELRAYGVEIEAPAQPGQDEKH